jgi:NPCBM/NEW2 domain
MPRGRRLFWTTIIGSVVAAAAVVIALIQLSSARPPKTASPPLAASSPVPQTSASASSRAAKSAPVVIPKASSTSSFSYISDLAPSGKLGELVYPGPVKIDGSIYPKSISFYCYDGDPSAFPVYRLKHNARRFEATVGMEAKWPSHDLAGVSLVGDGRTLRTFSVSVLKPRAVDVNVTGIHILTLECFAPGITSAASAANVEVAWGNARVTAGH